MGRLVGKSHFFTEAAFSQEKDDAASVQRAKKPDDDGETLLAEQVQAVKRLQVSRAISSGGQRRASTMRASHYCRYPHTKRSWA